MSLLLPKHLAFHLHRQPAMKVASYVMLSQVSDRKSTIPALIQTLSGFRRSDVIRWVCAISGRLGLAEGMETTIQSLLAEALFPLEMRRRIATFQSKSPFNTCIFHRRQTWLLLQFALLSCCEDTAERPEEDLRYAIGNCCLMASEILQQLEPAPPPPQVPHDVNEHHASLAVALMEKHHGAEIMARAQAFWFDLPQETTIKAKFAELEMCGFDEVFQTQHGVPFREFFLILFSVHARIAREAMSSATPLLSDQAFLYKCFNQTHVQQSMKLISQTPEEFAARLLRDPRQNWALDSTPLRHAPVIQLFSGRYACPDPPSLIKWLTDGIYYTLRSCYPEEKFAQLFGAIFEEYINRLILEFSSESAALGRNFYKSPTFANRKNEEAGDGLIIRNDTAFLMEYKSRVMTTRDKYSGDQTVTLRGIDGILYQTKKGGKKGVAQLAANLARILRGERLKVGPEEIPDLSKFQNLIPMVITYEESIAFEAIRQEADADLRNALQREGADPSRIGPLLVLSVDDVEILATTTQRSTLYDILQGYINHIKANPNDRMGSFRNFIQLHPRFGDLTNIVLWVNQAASRAYQLALNDLKGREPGVESVLTNPSTNPP